MKKFKFLYLLLIFLSLFNCSKDQTSELNTATNQPQAREEQSKEPDTSTVTYFTAEVSQEKDTEMTDDYLIIHDNNGKLIDFQSFEKGDSIKFNADQDSISMTFTVTQLTIFNKDEPRIFDLISYSEINRNSTWKIRPNFIDFNSDQSLTATGSFRVGISGTALAVPSAFKLTPRDNAGISNYFGNNLESETIWRTFVNPQIYENTQDFRITSYNDAGSSKVFILEDVMNNDSFEIDYEDFTDFDSFIDFSGSSLGNTNIEFSGYSNRDIDVNYSTQSGNLFRFRQRSPGIDLDPASIQIGYLDEEYTFYSFFVNYFYDYGYVRKYFVSTTPNSIRILDKPNVSITNSSFDNFSFTLDLDYLRSSSAWRYLRNSEYGQITWTVHAAANSYPKIREFPEELLEKYPISNIDSLEYVNTSFMLDSFSYPEFIEKTFVTQDIETTVRNEEIIILGGQ